MADVPLLDAPLRHWKCPACPAYAQTQRPEVHTEFHNCSGTAGLGVPMIEVESASHEAQARHVPVLGDGGAVTAISTEHGSGRVDCTVFVGGARSGN